MYKKTVTYTDYNDNERTEDFYFSFTKAELLDKQMSVAGGYATVIDNIAKTKDLPAMIKIFKELVMEAYGVKSDDGRRFVKSEELTREFMETPAFSEIYMGLVTDDEAAAEFINKVFPSSLVAEIEKAKKENPTVSNIPSKT